ncbi:glycosyltransferase [Metabacillus halosaccharovorans]|uniref:glycosyltransferase n=1 Tax=Metabacillus halosaccharovorans TaxID=930124 RepID=UPI00203CDCA5|nr:glycosyltransferase [Metabacillus halosaccharovorans]MCM3443788.1 glycosyltransferase [Metabacillus halosaccharovorans]
MFKTIKRVLFRNKKDMEIYARENKKVCMVVWNTFETDARVTKEAKSLIKGNKSVTVIAVNEPKRTKEHEVKEGIKIIRVNRTLNLKRTKKHSSSKNSQINVDPKGLNIKQTVPSKISTLKKVKRSLRFLPKWIVNIRFFTSAYKQNAGVYHAHDLNTLIPVFIVSRLRGAWLVYDAHEVSTDRAGWGNKKLWTKIERFLIKKADRVITTNLTRAEYFSKEYHINLPYIIRNVPVYQELAYSNRIREVLNINNDVPVILYQGGIQRERGLENLIKSIPKVKVGVFVFIGNGKLKPELISLVKHLDIEDRVYFLDAVPNEELLSYTASATIGMQTLLNTCFNHYSACSNKLHEYIMAGIPVIASDLPEMRKVVKDSGAGVLIDPENIDSISSSINALLEDKDRYNLLKSKTKSAAKKYSWDIEEKTLLEIYNIKES